MSILKSVTYDRLGCDNMIQVSLCMIVKDEEKHLNRCLLSIHDLMAEIIIVDTGSRDHTKDIALQYTDHVYDFPWCDNYSKARNFAFSKATCPYCMWMNADDILNKEDHQKLKRLLEEEKKFDMLIMKYHTKCDAAGKPINDYYRERIIRRDEHCQFEGIVNESIPLHGLVLYEDAAITHCPQKTRKNMQKLKILKLQKIRYGLFFKEQYHYAKELYIQKRYHEAIEEFSYLLKAVDGQKEYKIDACHMRGHCYLAIQKEKEAFTSFIESFYYGIPKSEILCDIAHHFFMEKQTKEAIFWYELAARQTPKKITGIPIETDCYDFIPYLQLSVCYDQLQDLQKAIYYNELAGYLKPGDEQYLQNRKYLKKKEAAL